MTENIYFDEIGFKWICPNGEITSMPQNVIGKEFLSSIENQCNFQYDCQGFITFILIAHILSIFNNGFTIIF